MGVTSLFYACTPAYPEAEMRVAAARPSSASILLGGACGGQAGVMLCTVVVTVQQNVRLPGALAFRELCV
ncbi:MAG TPA: hypothetical protein VNL36_04720 [Bacteroidota bacterium]|nr:hypothetical protein [Bacteroidota bacterium]